MKTRLLDYDLPRELIAQTPAKIRNRSRLLVMNRASGELTDSRFDRIGRFLTSGDCLVLNDTKVLQARFFARRASGAKLVGLFITQDTGGWWHAYLKGAAKVKVGETIYLKDRTKADFSAARVVEKFGHGRCRLEIQSVEAATTVLDRIGFPPLPPYIRRNDDAKTAAVDKLRYQTVYARKAGAIAAPTAGLHFTKRLIEQLKRQGIRLASVTLHVGIGTFRPITTRTLDQHQMGQERFIINTQNAQIINETKRKGGRIIAVGTTTVRTLETVAASGKPRSRQGQTGLFIRPGYRFKMVDGMVTNFHLPKTTLLALVAAFAGLDNILAAYHHAIQQRYRFYSYGDAMLIF
jgi:S-adenosylmethionine:tRNA ribosyltransferase-isomerase